MTEYIRREDVGLTDFEIVMCDGDYKEALKMLLEKVERLPPANVVERRTGKWSLVKDDDRYIYYCSCCNDWNSYGLSDFCPHCGADMRGGYD